MSALVVAVSLDKSPSPKEGSQRGDPKISFALSRAGNIHININNQTTSFFELFAFRWICPVLLRSLESDFTSSPLLELSRRLPTARLPL